VDADPDLICWRQGQCLPYGEGVSFWALTEIVKAETGILENDPPDVAGWDLGESWFSSGAMLARMNFGSTLAANQKFRLASAAKRFASTSSSALTWALGTLRTPPLESDVQSALANYLVATGPWSGSDAQLQAKVPGLVHLIAGAPEYQLI